MDGINGQHSLMDGINGALMDGINGQVCVNEIPLLHVNIMEVINGWHSWMPLMDGINGRH
jgi:hypothetical protein